MSFLIAMSRRARQSPERGSESLDQTRNYNENRVFATKRPLRHPGMELYFRGLDQKFVTRRNNGIFSSINEFCSR